MGSFFAFPLLSCGEKRPVTAFPSSTCQPFALSLAGLLPCRTSSETPPPYMRPRRPLSLA